MSYTTKRPTFYAFLVVEFAMFGLAVQFSNVIGAGLVLVGIIVSFIDGLLAGEWQQKKRAGSGK